MIVEKTRCSGCFACASVCPEACITMTKDNEGFFYPVIDETRCINCNLCRKTCPVIKKTNTNNQPVAYAVQNKNENIRMNSSSGGVFTLLAEQVINKGGVVFGAAFDENFNVAHIAVDNKEELYRLRGSKYVQSSMCNSYTEAKKYLKENRLVYFSGTPCQIGGLLSYIGREYDNLITQDIICHGVPSPMIWQKYLEYQTNKNSSAPESISFRKKKEGVSQYFLSIDFENGKKYEGTAQNDAMMIAFLRNLCLRNSCYNCSFKTKNRPSDFTIADYWGVQNVHPELNDKKGTSLVLVNSAKGEALFESIVADTVCVKSDVDVALSYNSSALKSAPRPETRELFMNSISSDNFEKTVNEFCKDSFSERIKKLIKKPVKKIKSVISKQ